MVILIPMTCFVHEMFADVRRTVVGNNVDWVFLGKSLPLQRTSHEFRLFNSFSTDFFSVGYGYNLFWNLLIKLQEVHYTVMRVLVVSRNVFNSKRFMFFYQSMSCKIKSEAPLWDIENL